MTSMTSIPTGEEYYRGRRESVADILDKIDGNGPARSEEEREEAYEELSELPLSVDVERHMVVLLGTGGPHDEIDFNVTTGEATYFYAWGSESFRRTLSESDPMYRLAEYFAEITEAGE